MNDYEEQYNEEEIENSESSNEEELVPEEVVPDEGIEPQSYSQPTSGSPTSNNFYRNRQKMPKNSTRPKTSVEDAEKNLEKAKKEKNDAVTEKNKKQKKVDSANGESNMVDKSRKERRADKKDLKEKKANLKEAKQGLRQAKRDKIVDTISSIIHPFRSLKNKAKEKAKDNLKAAAKNTIENIGKFLVTHKAALIGAIIAICFFALLVIFVVVLGGNKASAASGGVGGANVQYEIRGIEVDRLIVKIVDSNNSKTLLRVPFEKYVMGATVAQLGKDVLTSNPEAFKAALIINRNNLLSMEDDGTLGLNTSTKMITVNTTSNNLVYWDYEKAAYKLEKEDGTIIYSPEVTADTEGAIEWQNAPLSDAEINSLDSVASSVLGKYIKDASDNTKIYATELTDDIKTKLLAAGSEGKDYTEIIVETYGAGNVQIASGDVVFNYTAAAGDYANWKQDAKEWGSFKLGTKSSSTMKKVGCYVTSIAISYASLGAETTLDNFNPGTFAKALKNNGAFKPGGGLKGEPTRTKAIQSVVPNGTITSTDNGRIFLSGSKSEKFAKIKSEVTSNCAIVLQVKSGNYDDTHFVVLDIQSTEASGWTKLMMWNPSRPQNGDVYSVYKNSPLPYMDKVCVNQ